MLATDLNRLVDALVAEVRTALENAAALAARDGHSSVHVAHWLHALAERAEFAELLEEAGVAAAEVIRETRETLKDLPKGDPDGLSLSQNLLALAREAWVVASLQYGRDRIEGGDLLLALLGDQDLRVLLRGMAPSLRGLDANKIEAHLAALPERAGAHGQDGVPAGSRRTPGDGENEFLALYTQDMTQDAREGRIDPVVGRDRELRQLVDILQRRRQNNPMLVGEAGVGKTAVVEAFALAIAWGGVPEACAGYGFCRSISACCRRAPA